MGTDASGTQIGTPVATLGFGAREDADQTRQAGHGIVNDAQIYANPNGILVNSQMLSIDMLGKGMIASQERRQIIADFLLSGLKIA